MGVQVKNWCDLCQRCQMLGTSIKKQNRWKCSPSEGTCSWTEELLSTRLLTCMWKTTLTCWTATKSVHCVLKVQHKKNQVSMCQDFQDRLEKDLDLPVQCRNQATVISAEQPIISMAKKDRKNSLKHKNYANFSWHPVSCAYKSVPQRQTVKWRYQDDTVRHLQKMQSKPTWRVEFLLHYYDKATAYSSYQSLNLLFQAIWL